jgi:hypothetical protein
MITTISRAIVFGILAVAFLYVIPLLIFKMLLTLLVIGVLLRLLTRGKFGRGWRKEQPYFDSYTIYNEKESMNDPYQQGPKQM